MATSGPDLDLVKTVVAALALVSSVAAFAAGLAQYLKAQKWKVAEFLAGQMKEFDANPKIRFARQMMDISGYTIEVVKRDGEKEFIQVTHEDLAWHLRDHSDPLEPAARPERTYGRLSRADVAIREYFDALFEATDRFQSYIESGLIRSKHLDPYLGYILDQMSGPHLGPTLRIYLQRYGYSLTLKLLRERDTRKAGK